MNDASPVSTHLDGEHLALALRSGIYQVIAEQEILNRINVFPVADGDTGTNMSLSLSATLETLSRPGEKHLGTLLAATADALLDGARGNSGAIVAQFFQGMSDSAEESSRLTTHTFARAVSVGSAYAHDALAEPVEGTILSVIGEFARTLKVAASDNAGFAAALTRSLDAIQEALVRTEQQLDVLRKAGVVDAGAKGFVALVEGICSYLVNGRMVEKPHYAELPNDAVVMETAGSDEQLNYRFCTECIVTGEDIERRKLRESLSQLGGSLVLAGSKRKAKIHIHVNEPDAVFAVAGEYGRVHDQKADDMQRQQHSTHEVRAGFAVIVDSAADIADEDMESLDIHLVPARVQFGERGYLDKVGITTEEFFRELENNPHHPTTSQPSPGDFRRQYQFLASHFPDVISVNLTGMVSGTLQAAQAAADRTNAPGRIHVVNSLNVSAGQGLLTVFAAECAAAGIDVRTTLAALHDLIPQTFSFALVKDLRYAVRGGRVPASRKLLADLLHITPVLRSEPDGRISARGKLPGRRKLLPKFARFVAARSDKTVPLRLAIAHALCEDEAHDLETLLRERLPRIVKSSITGLGSALGVHGGPGTLMVGIQHYRDPGELRQKQPRLSRR